jgi:phage terminase large subunit-like protein
MITTAGAEAGSDPAEPTDPIAWRLYLEGLRQRDDPTYRPTWFFDWREASEDLDPMVRADIEQGIREASGAADIAWSVADRADVFEDPTRALADSLRYWWNRWPIVSGRSWLADTPTAWAACEDRTLPAHELGGPVWVGLDGAISGDSTAVAVVSQATGGRWLWSARVFDADTAGRRGVDWDAVRAYLVDLTRLFDVESVSFDPTLVTQFVGGIERDTGVTTVRVPQSVTRRALIDEWARTSIVAGTVAHRGDPTLTSHVRNARWRTSGDSRLLSKRASGRRIDALIACAMAHWRATAPPEEPAAREPAPLAIVSG